MAKQKDKLWYRIELTEPQITFLIKVLKKLCKSNQVSLNDNDVICLKAIIDNLRCKK